MCTSVCINNSQTFPSLLGFFFQFHFFVTGLPFNQAPYSASPLASATLCPSSCQKFLSFNLALPPPFLVCHLGLHLLFFFHTFSSADHNLNNNFKYTEDLETCISSSVSVLNYTTAGCVTVNWTSSLEWPSGAAHCTNPHLVIFHCILWISYHHQQCLCLFNYLGQKLGVSPKVSYSSLSLLLSLLSSDIKSALGDNALSFLFNGFPVFDHYPIHYVQFTQSDYSKRATGSAQILC